MGHDRQVLVTDVGVALQRYQRSVQSYDDRVGWVLGLGPADVRCLDWLVDGPKSAGELSSATGLRPAATTALIDRLHARGFVTRVASIEDRRKVLVEMTDSGRRRFAELYGPVVRGGREVLAGLDVDQLAMVRDLLLSITEVTDRRCAELER